MQRLVDDVEMVPALLACAILRHAAETDQPGLKDLAAVATTWTDLEIWALQMRRRERAVADSRVENLSSAVGVQKAAAFRKSVRSAAAVVRRAAHPLVNGTVSLPRATPRRRRMGKHDSGRRLAPPTAYL